ncbi:hypothetical protein Tco_0666091 [Tanacetum coccineum]
MMRRVDEFVRAEEAYARTELPPGESRDIHRRLSFPTGPRDVHQRLTFPTSTRNDRDNRSSQRRDYKGNDYKNPYKVRAGLRETRTDLVGFAGEVAKPLGKIDLEVCFGNEGLSRRMSIKFLVVRAPSPYNIILGRPGLKALHAIPSTIHSMIRFPTPKGIATLVTRATIIAECRLREGKQILTEKQPEIHEAGQPDEGADLTEQILVNPCFPDQIVTIGGRLSPVCKNQLKTLLINNMEVFAWEPSRQLSCA